MELILEEERRERSRGGEIWRRGDREKVR